MEVLAKKMAMVKCSGQIIKCMQGSPDPWAKAQDYVARAIDDKSLSKGGHTWIEWIDPLVWRCLLPDRICLIGSARYCPPQGGHIGGRSARLATSLSARSRSGKPVGGPHTRANKLPTQSVGSFYRPVYGHLKSKGKGTLVSAACWIAEQYKTLYVQKGNLEEKVHCLNVLVDSLKFSVENAAAINVSNQKTTTEYKQVCIENEQLKQRLRDAESLVATFRKAGADHSNCKSELKQLNAQLGARACVVSAVKVENTAKNDRNVTDVKCIKDSNMNCELAVKSKMLNVDCYRQAKPPVVTLKCTENRTAVQKQDVPKVQVHKPIQPRRQPGSERVFAIKATHPEKQSVYGTDTWIPYHVLKTPNERLSEENSSLKNAWGKFNNELESLKIEISQMKRTKDDVNRC
ncbi:uncharacterized protein LOC121401500 [Xenopus laevis]|uniref:Uncharacterized protein LOC121401500 n=1 Tax=Xenopus laevis TaxID=8355 RepID=A0A8J1MKQ0_XENLA|nr:uncharacterized protein LOC121401500 [Xenopus laevis]